MPHISAINVYPVKSCRGVSLERARITATGFEHDREWMIARPNGRFVTQREVPRLALIETALTTSGLQLRNPQGLTLSIAYEATGEPVEVVCWRDRCAAFDMGQRAADWLLSFLGEPLRLVRFDVQRKRPSDASWTDGAEALNQFSDGFPWLVISQASLDDLNTRLLTPLPMERFRPNIVIDDVAPYEEDAADELIAGDVRFRAVKPCTRCAITTTDQKRGERDGEEPLRTLRAYRFSRQLKGVMFGQNLILTAGVGGELAVGQPLELTRR